MKNNFCVIRNNIPHKNAPKHDKRTLSSQNISSKSIKEKRTSKHTRTIFSAHLVSETHNMLTTANKIERKTKEKKNLSLQGLTQHTHYAKLQKKKMRGHFRQTTFMFTDWGLSMEERTLRRNSDTFSEVEYKTKLLLKSHRGAGNKGGDANVLLFYRRFLCYLNVNFVYLNRAFAFPIMDTDGKCIFFTDMVLFLKKDK